VEPIAYKIDELKPLGGPGRDKAYKEIRKGKLRAVKNGRSTRILAADFQRYMAELPGHRAQSRRRAQD
jgi:excisionase family DNA binding protein